MMSLVRNVRSSYATRYNGRNLLRCLGFRYTHSLLKGQIISKANYSAFNSSKQTKLTIPRTWVKKMLRIVSYVRFLEEEETINCFLDLLTFIIVVSTLMFSRESQLMDRFLYKFGYKHLLLGIQMYFFYQTTTYLLISFETPFQQISCHWFIITTDKLQCV